MNENDCKNQIHGPGGFKPAAGSAGSQPEEFKRDYVIAIDAYAAGQTLTKHQCEILLRFEKVVAIPNVELIETVTRQLAAHRILEANPVLKEHGFEDKARRWNVLLAQARALKLTPAEQVEFIKKGMSNVRE